MGGSRQFDNGFHPLAVGRVNARSLGLLSFTSHAELRMEQRGVTEVEVRSMLERATSFEPNVLPCAADLWVQA